MIPGISSFVPGALRPANRELYHLADDLYDIQNRFTEVQCPVFIVHASDDKVVPHFQSENAAKMFVMTMAAAPVRIQPIAAERQ